MPGYKSKAFELRERAELMDRLLRCLRRRISPPNLVTVTRVDTPRTFGMAMTFKARAPEDMAPDEAMRMIVRQVHAKLMTASEAVASWRAWERAWAAREATKPTIDLPAFPESWHP